MTDCWLKEIVFLNSQLLFEIRDAVQGLGVLLAAQRGQEPGPPPQLLPAVPPNLENRFREAIELNRPDSFQTLDDFPLKEGWDALVWHFEEARKLPSHGASITA